MVSSGSSDAKAYSTYTLRNDFEMFEFFATRFDIVDYVLCLKTHNLPHFSIVFIGIVTFRTLSLSLLVSRHAVVV